ncbi:MAG: hypothetical protein KDA74_08745, partial [Planctomycetaceae bacterium]|nr:hypothetical protein [Planctomycetaceae bacterium]
MRAAASGYRESISDTASLIKLGQVTRPVLTVTGEQIHATWEAVSGAGSGYQIEWLKDGTLLKSEHVTSSGSLEPSGAGVYTVKVCAAGDVSHVTGAFSEPSNSIQFLESPVVESLSYADAKIHVTLKQVITGATGYRAQLITGETSVGEILSVSEPSQLSFSLNATDLAPGNYKVQVQAIGDSSTITSSWNSSTTGITRLSPPEVASLSYAADKVTVSLSGPVSGAGNYRAQLVNAREEAVGPVSTSGTDPQKIIIPATDVPPGNYKVRVMSSAENNQAISSDWNTVSQSTMVLGQISITEIQYTDSKITLTWSEVAGASGYQVEVLNPDDHSVADKNTPEPQEHQSPATTLEIDASTFPKGVTYSVHVKALLNQDDLTQWSEKKDILVVDIPEISSASYSANQLTVTWSGVDGAREYELQLFDSTKASVLTQETSTQTADQPPATSLTIDVSGLEKGAIYSVQVRAKTGPDQGGQWSSQYDVLVFDAPVISGCHYTDRKISLNWSAVSGATGYTVEILDSGKHSIATQDTPVA